MIQPVCRERVHVPIQILIHEQIVRRVRPDEPDPIVCKHVPITER